jgi:uncharacterized protein
MGLDTLAGHDYNKQAPQRKKHVGRAISPNAAAFGEWWRQDWNYFVYHGFITLIQSAGGKGKETMLYNVAQLMKAPVGTSLEYAIHEEDVQLDEDLKVIGPLDGHVRIRRLNQGLLVDGWVDLTLELTCNRCLAVYEYPMHVPYMEQFYPTVDIITGMPLPPIEEEDVFPIDDHHLVDLTEAIRQNVLLAIQWWHCAAKIARDSVHNVDMI